MLLFLVMTTLSMMPGNVWGDEIYTYDDKDGTTVITNIYPGENIIFKTWSRNSNQDSEPPEETTINFHTRQSNSYQDANAEDRLHWGRDSALIDELDERNKGDNRQRKRVKDGKGIETGIYRLTIKKIASNLYKDIFTHIIIKTGDCFELADIDEALLDWSTVPGELRFKNAKKSCVVKKVYK
jgi:hypothetical protein